MKANLLLKKIIERKKIENPRLSLRWIARKTGISSGRLSELMNAKRPLTQYYASKLCQALKLSEDESQSLYNSTNTDDSEILIEYSTVENFEQLIDWKNFALLSFFQTSIYLSIALKQKNQDEQIKEISALIQIPAGELTALLKNMESANVVEWQNETWSLTRKKASAFDFTNRTGVEGHRNILSLAERKLTTLSAYDRDFSSMTFSIDPKDFDKVKKKIRNFKKNLAQSFEKANKVGVYQMNVQFFPIMDPGTAPNKKMG